MSDSAIHLEGVTKRFGNSVAVDDLDLEIGQGEFFSLLGPSGCGKTTTLRMVAGFEQPSEGRIYLEGEPVETVPPYERNVNTVFQSYALFEHLSIADNVAFGLKRRKVPKDEIKTRVAEALDLVELLGREKDSPRELSGGQKQRVALARALVNRPSVLLLDEPLGALDLKLRKQMQVELKGIQREVGITFLYVTHDQEEALAMSDRIAVMEGGKVKQCGTPEEVYEHPTGPFVAGFIGVSNLLPGVAANGGVQLEGGDRCAAKVPADCRRGHPRAALGAPGEDLGGRARGRHGLGRGDDRRARLRGHHDAGDRRARRRSAPGGARAEHRARQVGQPLGDRRSGAGRLAPRAFPGTAVKRLAACVAAFAALAGAAPAPAAAEPLTVMTFNVWYGGVQVDFDQIGRAIREADADVVGVQEPEGNLRAHRALGRAARTSTRACT